MRKNSPRKWLHACLDLLPVILIPVFMIYSHRHTIDSGTIEVPQNQVIDFNQHAYTDIHYDNYGLEVDSIENTNIVTTQGILETDIAYYFSDNLVVDDIYISYILNSSTYNLTTNTYSPSQNGYTRFTASDDGHFFMYFNTGAEVDFSFTFRLFNLTQMFGSGNEPSVQDFSSWFTGDYYEYTISHRELLKNTSTITYDDTDIMSQFTYQLYNAVDKYFNMGNVFNMTSVYDWFNLNIFGGNAPISIYIVWNIVLYEFVMDLLFLLYGLFMWFIDMVEHIMDKPFKSIK